MMDYYILNEQKEAVPADLDEWARFFERGDRIIARNEIGAAMVSTVFLGINHQHGDGPPLLFETMIFGGAHDEHQERCSTYEEAVTMHRRAVELASLSADVKSSA